MKQGESYFSSTLSPLLLSLAIGMLAGFGAVLFRKLIGWGVDALWPPGTTFAGHLMNASPVWRLAVPCLVGLAAGPVIAFWAPELRGPGVPEVMKALALKHGRIRHRVTALKAVVTALLISSGASVGREGPIVQIGSSIGSSLSQFLKRGHMERRLAVACGAAAGIAATFQAPMAGTLFAVEILLFDLEVSSLSNIVMASVTGTVVARACLGESCVFRIPEFVLVHPAELAIYFILGICAGLVSLLLIKIVFALPGLWRRVRVPDWLRPAFGGLMIGVLGLLCPQALGVGYDGVQQALDGAVHLNAATVFLGAKILATALCIGSGMSGGIFAPSLFLGAMLGSVVGDAAGLLWPGGHLSSAHYALVGMGAVVGGTTLAPITAILTIFELTYTYKVILPLMVACIPSVMVVRFFHGFSIYETKLIREGVNIVRGHEVNKLRNMSVREIMTRDMQTLRVDTPIDRIITIMEESSFPHFVVLDEKGMLAGVLTLRDLRALLAYPERRRPGLVAGDLMQAEPVTVNESDNLETAFHLFARYGFAFLPVISSSSPGLVVGQLKKTDLLSAYDEQVLKEHIFTVKTAQGSRLKAQGSKLKAQGSKLKAQRKRLKICDFLPYFIPLTFRL